MLDLKSDASGGIECAWRRTEHGATDEEDEETEEAKPAVEKLGIDHMSMASKESGLNSRYLRIGRSMALSRF